MKSLINKLKLLLGKNTATLPKKFRKGDRVKVAELYPLEHVRTPFYIRGKVGVITATLTPVANPEELAYGRSGLPKVPLYRVSFLIKDIWADYQGAATDELCLEILQHWLEPLK